MGPEIPTAQPDRDSAASSTAVSPDQVMLDRLAEVEAQLIGQEHRLPMVLMNAWSHAFGGKGDRRAVAARRALVWRLFSTAGATTAVAGVGITAVAGVYIAWQANKLVANQNDLIGTQNALISSQNQLSEAQRRAALVFELTSILDEIDEELDQADVHTSGAISRKAGERAGTEPLESLQKLPRLRDQESQNIYRLSPRLVGRIVALSRSLRPYRFIGENGEMLAEPYSPERGQLFVSLIDSQVDMEDINHSSVVFDRAELRGLRLRNVDLTHARLFEAELRDAQFDSCVMHYAQITHSNCGGARFGGCQLYWCSFEGSDLTGASLRYSDPDGVNMVDTTLDYADLRDIEAPKFSGWDKVRSAKLANISGMKNAAPEVLARLKQLGATDLPEAEWRRAVEADRGVR